MSRNVIKWGKTTAEPVVSDLFTTQQVNSGKTSEAMQVLPYGLYSKLPVDSLCMLFAVQGVSENRAMMAVTPMPVPESAVGEVLLYHPKSQTFIALRDNGDIDIKSTKVNVVADEINLTGDINLTGNLTQTGDYAVTGSMTANGKIVDDTHGHAQGPDSDGNGQSPISGVT